MELLAWIYPASSTILAAFYIPQIISVMRAKNQLKDVSLLSWGVWSVCPIVSFLYSLLIAHDKKIAFFNLVSSVACLIVFSITFYKRHYKFKTAPEQQTSSSSDDQLKLAS